MVSVVTTADWCNVVLARFYCQQGALVRASLAPRSQHQHRDTALLLLLLLLQHEAFPHPPTVPHHPQSTHFQPPVCTALYLIQPIVSCRVASHRRRQLFVYATRIATTTQGPAFSARSGAVQKRQRHETSQRQQQLLSVSTAGCTISGGSPQAQATSASRTRARTGTITTSRC